MYSIKKTKHCQISALPAIYERQECVSPSTASCILSCRPTSWTGIASMRQTGLRSSRVSDRRIHISNWGPPTRHPSSSHLPPITATYARLIDSACPHPPPDLTLSQPTDPAHVPPCRPLSPIDVTRARHPARRIATQPVCTDPPRIYPPRLLVLYHALVARPPSRLRMPCLFHVPDFVAF